MFDFCMIEFDGHRMLVSARGRIIGDDPLRLESALRELLAKYDEVVLDVAGIRAMTPDAAERLILMKAIGADEGRVLRIVGLERSRIELCLLVKLLTAMDGSAGAVHRLAHAA